MLFSPPPAVARAQIGLPLSFSQAMADAVGSAGARANWYATQLRVAVRETA
jgi:hypothetical protein